VEAISAFDMKIASFDIGMNESGGLESTDNRQST